MNIPQKIVDMIEKWKESKDKELCAKIDKWLDENVDDAEIFGIAKSFVTDKPTGEEQFNGEYCEQYTGFKADDYYGKYYFPIENSNKYLGFECEC